MLQILNSQSRKKEEFKPIVDGRVNMYTCGPTVYDSLHLGHARAAVTPDVVRRYLEYKGYHVRFVMNFTDVDDKIIKRAIKEKTDFREITAKYIAEFHRVMQLLNVKPADVFPRATDHIPEMLEIVRVLLEKKHAYIASDGDIYFDTTTYERYGALSGRKLEDDEAGASGRVDEARQAVKKNVGDFVLWKVLKNDKPEISVAHGDKTLVARWPSPWGEGRPGWHLECSAMSRKYLGAQFDIHCGGQDLLFPHHEDEKAQTECAYCDELKGGESVKYWVHNAFVNVKARPEDEKVSGDLIDAASGAVKMSKSLGNVKWLREMIWPEGPYDPMAVRMMLLSSHYRSPIIFEPAMLDEASARLERIYNALETLKRVAGETVGSPKKETLAAFDAAMDDDFNTAGAIGVIFEYVGAVNQALAKNSADAAAAAEGIATITRLLDVLGLRTERAKQGGAGDSEKLIDLLMQSRQDARAAKAYQLGDKIRDGIKALGYEVEDLPGGKWNVKKK
jgi:cysteinyl-tRNA synthetase